MSTETTKQRSVSYLGILSVALGIFLIVSTQQGPPDSAELPRLIGILMIVVGGAEVARLAIWGLNAAEKEEVAEGASKKYETKPALLWIVASAAYVVLIPVVGFYATTVVFLPLTMTLLGIRRPIPIMAITVISVLAIYFIFTSQLQVRLPTGIFI